MTRVTVLYPRTPGTAFDHEYFTKKHLPLVRAKIGSDLKALEAVKVEADGMGGDVAFWAIATMDFDSAEVFQSVFGNVGGDLLADIPNYTDSQPQIKIGEIIS